MANVTEELLTTANVYHWLNISGGNFTENVSGLFNDEDYRSTLGTPNISIVKIGDDAVRWEDILIIIFKALVMVTIIIVALMGNALVIVSISLNRKLQVLTNFFLVSLAIADMLVALCAMTFNASVELSGRWLFGYIMCDLWNSFDVYFSTVSILHLCCISMDRYYAILNPLEYPVRMTKRIVLIMLAHVWFAPTLISFLPIFMGWYTTSDHLQDRTKKLESCTFEVNKVFAILSSAVSFWIPCTVMLILYYRIFKEARKQETAIMSRTNSMSTLHNIHRGISPTAAIRRIISRLRSGKMPQNTTCNSSRLRRNQDFPMCPLAMGCARNVNRDRTQSIYSTTSEVQMPCSFGHGGRTSPCRCSHSQRKLQTPACIITEPESDPISPSSPIASIHAAYLPREMSSTSDETTKETNLNNGHSEPSCRSYSSGLMSSSTRTSSTCNQLMIPVSHIGGGLPVMRREHKAAKTLGIVMGAFILCWLPFFIWYVTITICGDSCPCPQAVITTLFWIGYFNSTLNPFIYAYFRRDFREAFKKTLRRLRCCCIEKDSLDRSYV